MLTLSKICDRATARSLSSETWTPELLNLTMVPLSAPLRELAGVRSAPYRSVIEVMVVSAHSPTLPGSSEIRSVLGRSSLNTGSGGGCQRSGEALPIDRSDEAAYDLLAAGSLGAGPAVHNDLGVALLEGGDAARLSGAGQEFQHALMIDPQFAAAVFNLALFYERMNEPVQAAAQWKRYIELDSKSDWEKEARVRLQGLSR